LQLLDSGQTSFHAPQHTVLSVSVNYYRHTVIIIIIATDPCYDGRMNHYIAMDGGGTTCRLLLGTDDAILHHAQGESSNPYGVGWESAIRHVQSLITDSLEATGRDAKQVTALVLGSAGMGKPADQIRFASAIAPLLPNARIKVCGDQEIFLVGGLGGLSGIAVIAGTGSIACGRNEQGSVVRAGGFGWRLWR
jgi:N-acetylglucosamine kinase-like BadF-type ATPase